MISKKEALVQRRKQALDFGKTQLNEIYSVYSNTACWGGLLSGSVGIAYIANEIVSRGKVGLEEIIYLGASAVLFTGGALFQRRRKQRVMKAYESMINKMDLVEITNYCLKIKEYDEYMKE